MPIVSSITLPPVHPFSGQDVATLLASRVASRGDHDFMVWEPPGGEAGRWTYAEFGAAVDRVAAGFVARSVRRGDGVMILLENCPAFLMCWFALARLGAVAVDVNTRYSTDELAYAETRTPVVGIVTHDHLAPNVPVRADRWVVTVDDATGTVPALDGDPTTLPVHDPDPGAASCVQFTSGTTSHPKAVLYTHANALWAARTGAANTKLTPDAVSLVYAPLFHTQALAWQTLATLWVGATIVLIPKYTASRFWDISLRHGCTHTNFLPIMLHTLGEEVPDHSYRVWMFGLETPAVEERFGVRLFCGWGMTESVIQAIANDIDHREDAGAIGRVVPGYRIRIRADDGTDAAVGEVGDLWVGGQRGIQVFAEYYGDPEATAAAFDGDGCYDTGDRVRQLPSGVIQFVTRAKDMLKVGAENVAAAEIERVLTGCPGVRAAGVVGRPDPILDEVAVAFVVATPGADVGALPDAAIAHCREHLADFKVPRRVYVIDALPESLLGKIAKGELKERADELAAAEGAAG